MKSLFLLVLPLLLSSKWGWGQTDKSKVESLHQIGIVANGIMDNFYNVPDGFGKDFGFGWSTGIYFIRGTKNLCFMSELLFAKRNFLFNQNFSDPATSYDFKGELDLTHLLLNIHFLVAPQLNANLRLLAGGGPYFGYGLSAKRKQTETTTSAGGVQSTYTEANLGFGENGAQRAEIGLQGKLGLILGDRLLLNAGYAINGRRILTESEDFRTHMFYIGAGYNLRKRN